MNEYLAGLKELFEKHGLDHVYSRGRFEKEPMRNPMLYVYKASDTAVKKEITEYLERWSPDHHASFSMVTIVPPKDNELIYRKGEWL